MFWLRWCGGWFAGSVTDWLVYLTFLLIGWYDSLAVCRCCCLNAEGWLDDQWVTEQSMPPGRPSPATQSLSQWSRRLPVHWIACEIAEWPAGRPYVRDRKGVGGFKWLLSFFHGHGTLGPQKPVPAQTRRRLIRDGSPARPPRLSHSSWPRKQKPYGLYWYYRDGGRVG